MMNSEDAAATAIGLHGAQQKLGELTAFLEFLKARPPLRHVLEIGSWTGGTLWLWLEVAAGTVVSIDQNRVPNTGNGMPYHVVGDSHKSTTRVMVPDLKFDLVFIDGDHTDKGVRKDYEMYAPMVAPGGLVALHDIVWHPAESGIYVQEFWDELKARERTVEFVDPHPCALSRQVTDDAGIGVVLCP